MIFHGIFMGAVFGIFQSEVSRPSQRHALSYKYSVLDNRRFSCLCSQLRRSRFSRSWRTFPGWSGGKSDRWVSGVAPRAQHAWLMTALQRCAPAVVMTTAGRVDDWCVRLVFLLFFQMPRNTFEEMKYLEIMIVSDHSMVGVPLRARAITVDLVVTFWLFSTPSHAVQTTQDQAAHKEFSQVRGESGGCCE